MCKTRRQVSILPWVSLLSIGHAHVWMVVVCLTSRTCLHIISNVCAILIHIVFTSAHFILILVLYWLVSVQIILPFLTNEILVSEFTSWHLIWITYLLKRDFAESLFIVNLICNITVNVGHYLWLMDIISHAWLLLVDHKAVYC